MQINDQKIIKAHKYIRQVLQSEEYKRGLNSSEKEQLRQFFKQSIGKIVSEKNSEEFAEIEKLLTEEEKLHAQERKDVRANQGVLDNAANDILRATTRLPMAAVDLSAWLAQMVGADDTAQSLAQFSADKKYDIEQALPGAEFNAQNPDSWLPSADFISSTAIENLPLMLATGAGSKALIGGATKLSGAPLSRGITKALEITGTGIGMSLPETYSDAMTQDALGNVELPKSALVPAMMAIPHAAVEVGLGISPVKLADLGSKKFLTSNFVEKMSRYARRYGTAQAAKYTVNQLFGDGFGEGAEELAQGVIGIFNRNLANKDVGQAISDSVDELMEDKTWNDLYQQFVGGVTTGTVYSGGKSAIDRVSSNAIEKAKAGDLQGANADINAAINDKNTSITEKQDLAKQKEVLQLPYIISNSTADSLRDSDLNQSQIIHPFENWDGGNPYETVGTMDDYRRYKSEKEVNKPFPESPMALLNEFKALYGQNDNPRWQRLQEHVTNKYGTSQALAKEDYPAGKIGKALRALDEVETKPASANSFEYDPETDIPLLPYEPNKADGRQLPEGSIIKDSRNDDIITLKSGKPFKNEKIAKAFQSKKNLKDSHDITPVRGRFVLMKKPVLQEPRRVTVETPKEGNYQRGSEAYVSGITIPTENRTLVRGNSEAAARLEKKLPQQQPDIALPAQKLATAKDENTKRAILEDYNRYLASNKAAYEEYKSKPEVAAKIPGMQNVIKEYEAVKTAVENELANVHLPPESKITEQTDRKQWYIDADDKPVFTTKSDSMGYRGPYSKQEIKDLTEVDPAALTEKNYGKEATLARREQAVTKNGYKVESYQGGFRVLDPEGKQYSWHTGRQAADDKAADLNSGKIALVKSETKPESKPETQPATRITAENAEMLANAQKLRKSAASLLEQAQTDLSRDRQTNTARRARMAAGATDDALNREAFAKTMNNLADAMERGEVRYLKGVKSRPDLMLFKNELTLALGRHARKNDKPYDWYKKEPVTDAAIRDGAEFNRPHPYGDWFDHAARELETIQGMKPAAAYIEKLGRGNRSRNVSLSDDAIGKILDIKKTIAKKGIKTPYQFARILETVEDYQKLKAAGIKSDFDLADALIEYRNLEADKKQESQLVKAERELIGKKFEGFDFFPTPPALAERMAQELDIKPGMKVLEPSAGKGDLADAVKAAQPEADVKVIEPLSDLREILTMKNHEVIDTNFENFETDQKFDRVIMNPPFSKNRDIRHVRKAYELLAPGGKMVAIMGNHFTFANDKESAEFRDWLDAAGGTSESLGQVFAGKDAFRQTGVNSQLVTIEKPAETSFKAEPGKAEVSGQTVPPAASDLVKPKEKDFESATDYLKALTVWREKTGNLTAAEVKRRDRALRYADRAVKTGQKASGLFRQADKISERFYMGQPILVGHHSERGARAAQNRMHNKMDAALREEKKAEYYSQRAESAEKNKSISSADEDAIVKLKAKLESLSKVQERMKQANKVVKASKLSDAEKITKLQEQGFSEAKAKNLLEKDFAGRVGFPAYALQNNNAEMSRLKKRIEELSVKQSQQTQKIEFDGGEIVDNVAENRLQIFFDSKPDEATREKLKSNGFRWAPSAGAWQMHRSTWANRKAESITGAKIPAAQPAQAATAEDKQEIKPESAKEPLYSAEYLVARYAKRGLNKAGQVVKHGLDLIRQAGVTFARWARQMVNDFGKAIRKHLRTLWTDLDNFNKRLGRTGAISGRSTGLKNGEIGQSSPPPGKTAHEMLIAKWTKKGLEKAYRFGDKLYQAGKTTFADWQKYMQGRFKEMKEPELRDLWQNVVNPEKSVEQIKNKPLRDNNVPASPKAFKMLGLKPDRIYADYSFLQQRHSEYFDTPEEVRSAVEFVLADPELSTAETDGNGGLVRASDGEIVTPVSIGVRVLKHPKIKIELEKKRDGYHLRSVHLLSDEQLERDKSRRGSAPLDAGVTTDKLTEGSATVETEGNQAQADAKASSTKNDNPSGQNVKPAGPVTPNRKTKYSNFSWLKDNNKQLRLRYSDPNTGKTEIVATITKNPRTKRWEWKENPNRQFFTLPAAKAFIKSTNYERKRRAERNAEKARRRSGLNDDYFDQIPEVKKKKIDQPQTWKEKAEAFVEKATTVLFDKWHALKKVQDNALKASGLKNLPDDQNAYQRLEVLTGRIQERTADFREKYWQPILDCLNKHKISYEQFNEFLRVMHAEERNAHIDNINPEFRERGIPGSGMSNEVAVAKKQEYTEDGIFETLMEAGKMYWQLNKVLLDEQVKYGLLSQEMRDSFAQAYKYYTPLKSPPDQGRNLEKRTLGRRSESSDQLSYTLQAILTTFSRGEINRKNLAFLRFALKNPNDSLYTIHTAKKKPIFNKQSGEVEYYYDRFSQWEDEVLHAKFNGKDVAIRITDPELLDAVKNRGDLESGFLVRQLHTLNRVLSGVNTAWNPEFVMTNLLRDVQTAMVNASSEESAAMAKAIFANIRRAIRAGFDAKRGKSTGDTSLLKEFELQGGKTGYSEFYQLEELAEDLETEMNARLANGTLYKSKQFWKKFTDLVGNANEIIESGTRFAGYLAARDAGMSKQQAAAFAKNLTVNFNKRGTAGQLINTLYLFGNASLQGSARVISVLRSAAKSKTGKTMIAAAIGFGFVMDIINRLLAGEDDEEGINTYDKLLSSEKDNNFILMLPGKNGKYLKFPMPHGFNVLPALGRNASAFMFGEQSFKDTISHILGVGFGAFNPMGNDERGILWNLTPTAVKPALDIATNSKWTGRKIRPDQPMFTAKQPYSQLVFKNTSKQLTAFTQWLNEATGGNAYESGWLDVSPGEAQHLLETASGGMGKTFLRAFDSIGRGISKDDEVEIGNVPFLRRLAGKAGDYSTYDRFRSNFEHVKIFEQAKREKNMEWLRANRWLVPATALAKRAERQIKAIKDHHSLSESQKQERIITVQKLFNKKFKEMNKKALSKN